MDGWRISGYLDEISVMSEGTDRWIGERIVELMTAGEMAEFVCG